jgi:hypothetical protein
MNICERCGHEYRFFVDHGGHKLCRNCWDRCSICGQKLPMSNKIGQTMTAGTALFTPMAMLSIAGKMEKEQKPWLGSGLCMNCYHAKEKKEMEEQDLIRKAQLRQARDIVETPSTWDCPYCKTVNRGNFCQNCGSPRKRTESIEEDSSFMVEHPKK